LILRVYFKKNFKVFLVGKEVLFVEKEHIKGKDFLPLRVKERLGLD
jgi:hypothetical protein